MKITSTAFENNASIPQKYTCDGEDVSLPFTIADVPEGTQSLALVSDDPDSPSGTWLHWTLWNIDPATTALAEGVIPEGAVEGTQSFGDIGYGGPCPSSGTHRYFFKLFALDTILDLPRGATLDELNKAMDGHILEKAELMGRYKRGGE